MTKDKSIEHLETTINKQVDAQMLELELKAKGMCVCDNYKSYRSTLTPNTVYAMMHQPEQCVNCVDICNAFFSAALNDERKIQPAMLAQHYNHRYNQINLGRIRVCNALGDPVSVTQLLNQLEHERKRADIAIKNGRAEMFLNMWKQRLK